MFVLECFTSEYRKVYNENHTSYKHNLELLLTHSE